MIKINGLLFKSFLEYGLLNLKNNKEIVNELNVFPVPDGDTGDNMLLTLNGAYNEVKNLDNESISFISSKASYGALLNARGNSGVILSQLIKGLSLSLENKDEIDLLGLKDAFKEAVNVSYKAVENPTEGTILTVARETYESLDSLKEDISINDLFKYILEKINESVINTPEKLEVLKNAGVVDSGGAGLYYIFEGIYKYLNNESIFDDNITEISNNSNELDTSNFNADSKLEYGYCSEIMLQLMNYKCDVENFNLEEFRSFLNSIGDSIVLVQNQSIVKVHVHTFEPYKLLEYAQRYGEFTKVKIENMTIQHTETTIRNRFEIKTTQSKEKKEFGIVSVASGDGIISLFKELGSDYVISGGQTNNPSTESFLNAFKEVNAKNIFVLPNNSNIILTAKQAKDLYKDSNIIVLETKSIGDGYSALQMLDYSSNNVETIKENMIFSYEGTKTIEITKSIRDTSLNGISIKKDDYIGFMKHDMLSSNKNVIDTLKESVDKADDHNEILMVIYGMDSKEEDRLSLKSYLKENHKYLEYYEIEGKQDVYDYYLILQ